MASTITEALIYEKQGLLDQAMLVYKNILRRDPNNIQAKNNLFRLSGQNVDSTMLEAFLRLNDDDIQKLKRWLVKL